MTACASFGCLCYCSWLRLKGTWAQGLKLFWMKAERLWSIFGRGSKALWWFSLWPFWKELSKFGSRIRSVLAQRWNAHQGARYSVAAFSSTKLQRKQHYSTKTNRTQTKTHGPHTWFTSPLSPFPNHAGPHPVFWFELLASRMTWPTLIRFTNFLLLSL